MLMVVCAVLFGISNSLVPYLSAVAAPVQMVVFANLFAIVLVLPWARHDLLRPFRKPRTMWTMVVISGLSNVIWFEALATANLSLATALSFAAPLIAMPIAARMLGERISAVRWAAVAFGFAGTLVVLRPWRSGLDAAVWLALAATVMFVGVYLTMRLLAGSESPARVVLMMSVGQVLSGLPFLPSQWRPLDAATMGGILLMALVMQIGRVGMQRAFAMGRASVVMPLDFLRLPAIAAIAWLWFGQTPDLPTFAGAAMIVAASVTLARAGGPRS